MTVELKICGATSLNCAVRRPREVDQETRSPITNEPDIGYSNFRYLSMLRLRVDLTRRRWRPACGTTALGEKTASTQMKRDESANRPRRTVPDTRDRLGL